MADVYPETDSDNIIKAGIDYMGEKRQLQDMIHYDRAVMLYGQAVSAHSETERERLLEEAFCEVREAIVKSDENSKYIELRDNIVARSKSLQAQADLINKIPTVDEEG